jgi:transposase
MIVVGSVKAKDFAYFIGSMLQILEEKKYFSKWVFVFDNASIHKGGEYKEQLLSKITCINLAPYSPFLNPIEEVFALWKRAVRSSKVEIVDQLVYGIATEGHKLKASHFTRIYEHAYSFYYPCYFREVV